MQSTIPFPEGEAEAAPPPAAESGQTRSPKRVLLRRPLQPDPSEASVSETSEAPVDPTSRAPTTQAGAPRGAVAEREGDAGGAER